jgi:hypothetical protein
LQRDWSTGLTMSSNSQFGAIRRGLIGIGCLDEDGGRWRARISTAALDSVAVSLQTMSIGDDDGGQFQSLSSVQTGPMISCLSNFRVDEDIAFSQVFALYQKDSIGVRVARQGSPRHFVGDGRASYATSPSDE